MKYTKCMVSNCFFFNLKKIKPRSIKDMYLIHEWKMQFTDKLSLGYLNGSKNNSSYSRRITRQI